MLKLPHDTPITAPLLTDHLAPALADPALEGPARILLAIAASVPDLAMRLAAGHLPGDPAAIVGTNDSGDKQKALDVGAHEHLLTYLGRAPVRLVLSEEAEEICTLDAAAGYDVAIDPIDGSGSIGIGAPLGLLFAIFPAAPEGFLRAGRAAIAAGYVSFGHSIDMGFSLGQGVDMAVVEPGTADFRVTRTGLTIKPASSSLAYNASNARHWAPGVQRYIHEAIEGKDGPLGKNFNMRWLGAAVGDLHRILMQGGTFLYPADRRPGYENGRLRLLYEAIPMAFILEQAGGAATDGVTDILDLVPEAPHQHTALVFGGKDDVERLRRYLTEPN